MKRILPLKWVPLYTDENHRTRYGPLKRGDRIVANGLNERDGRSICKAVNRKTK